MGAEEAHSRERRSLARGFRVRLSVRGPQLEMIRMSAATVPVSDIYMTEEEYFALGETRIRFELLSGSLVVSPNPSRDHQQISRRLANALEPDLPEDLWVAFAVNVRLGRDTVVIPDVVIGCDDEPLFIRAENVAFVAEVVSPGNAGYDRVMKMNLYAAAGIPWYLLVEREGGNVILKLHRLAGDHYVVDQVAAGEETLQLVEPVKVDIVPNALLRR